MPPKSSNSRLSGWLSVIAPAAAYLALSFLLAALLDTLLAAAFPRRGAALAGAASLGAKLLLLPWLLCRYRAEADERKGKVLPQDLLLCLGSGLAIGGLSAWLGNALAVSGPAAASLCAGLDVCVLGPACEELVFRGLVMGRGTGILGRKWGFAAGVLLFAAAHADWRRMLLSIPMGLVLGAVMEKKRTLILPAVLHMAANTAVFLIKNLL